MRHLLIFILAISCSLSTAAQSLEGVWKGQCTYEGMPGYATSIALSIQQGDAQSYVIHSYTLIESANGLDTIIICKVNYEKIGSKSFKLQEYKFLNGDLGPSALQTMFLDLKLKKGKTILTGHWESPDELSPARKTTGRITLTRQ